MPVLPEKPAQPENRNIVAGALFAISAGLVQSGFSMFASHLPASISMELGISLIWAGMVPFFFALFLLYPEQFKKKVKEYGFRSGVILLFFVLATTFGVPEFIRFLDRRSIEKQTAPMKKSEPSVSKQIFLYEKYGGEWQTSNAEPIVFKNNEAILINKFMEGKVYRFTPTIQNANRKMTIINPVQLFINIPSDVKVERTRYWVGPNPADGNYNQYVAVIPSDIPPGTSNTLNESLFLTFPKVGRYKATYSINGTTATGEGLEPELRIFYFDLTE